MQWIPANDRHAIERVAFAARLDFPLAPKGFQSLLNKIGKKATGAGINEIALLPPPVIPLQISALDPISGVPQQVPINVSSGGRIYRKTENGRVLEEMVCNETTVVFAATKYNHWSDFISRVEECLSDALNYVSSHTNIVDIRLEYWDRFDKRSEKDTNDNVRAHGLINPNSILIAPFYERQTGSWHSHCGFFIPDGNEMRTLVNSNVDVVVNSPGLPRSFADGIEAQARFYTLAAAQYITPSRGFDDWPEIKDVCSNRHRLLKSVLSDLITPELSDRIALAAESLAL